MSSGAARRSLRLLLYVRVLGLGRKVRSISVFDRGACLLALPLDLPMTRTRERTWAINGARQSNGEQSVNTHAAR
eukprot:3664262-Prymnesium_polylepis.3